MNDPEEVAFVHGLQQKSAINNTNKPVEVLVLYCGWEAIGYAHLSGEPLQISEMIFDEQYKSQHTAYAKAFGAIIDAWLRSIAFPLHAR